MLFGQTFPAVSQDSLRSVASAVTASRRKGIGRNLRGQVFATKQRSDAGARVLESGAVLRNIGFLAFFLNTHEKAAVD